MGIISRRLGRGLQEEDVSAQGRETLVGGVQAMEKPDMMAERKRRQDNNNHISEMLPNCWTQVERDKFQTFDVERE